MSKLSPQDPKSSHVFFFYRLKRYSVGQKTRLDCNLGLDMPGRGQLLTRGDIKVRRGEGDTHRHTPEGTNKKTQTREIKMN